MGADSDSRTQEPFVGVQSTSRRPRPPRGRAWWLIYALAASSASLWIGHPALSSFGGALPTCITLFGLFLITERTTIRFEFGRQTVHVGMAEFPVALGLFVVEPRALLLCRVASGLVVYGMSRRYSPQKKVFNLVLISFEVAIASTIFLALGQPVIGNPVNWHAVAEPGNWLAAVVAGLAFVVAGTSCVYAGIGLTQGLPSRAKTFMLFVPTIVLAPFATMLALVVLLVMSVSYQALGLVAVLFLMAVVGYRAYAQVVQQHATLGQVYGFSQFLEQVR